eukprot:TRINITY_DN30628_c0_g1_i1.p1 TRINITY_DN30628_c0_g1~~TRINITY_DN30628_c0_g1_i1.p1  ORF type:complete len:297 (-),score=64.74 TRINITY_DN30628_c0_g1_i1:56-946(-)
MLEDKSNGKEGLCGSLLVLATAAEREEFISSLTGRVLHVKGFGRCFLDSQQQNLAREQMDTALTAMRSFKPDFLVVDGDPFKNGFQAYIQHYVDQQKQLCGIAPKVIWAKNAGMDDAGNLSDANEKQHRLQQAQSWEAAGMDVIVYFISDKSISEKVRELYGVEADSPAKFSERGLVQLFSAQPSWMKGVNTRLQESISNIESNARQELRFFEKCSFENSAKGNVIFEALHTEGLEKHGVICFGGGESVLLEIASKYCNEVDSLKPPSSDVAVFLFSRGKSDDPLLVEHVGESFRP